MFWPRYSTTSMIMISAKRVSTTPPHHTSGLGGAVCRRVTRCVTVGSCKAGVKMHRVGGSLMRLDLDALACIAHKSLEICEQCKLRQQNSRATPENSAAFNPQ